MSDLIDRQALLQALCNEDGELHEYCYPCKTVLIKVLALPPVQPYTDAEIQKMQDIEQAELQTAYELGKQDAQSEPQWIPCSERLPDKETYVLISKKPHPLTGKKWCVTIAGRFVDGRSRKPEWRDVGFGRIVDDEILAWMPLPEPYKEDNNG